MDDISEIVDEIVHSCSAHGLDVSDTLAAFIARTVVQDNSATFRLDRELAAAEVQQLVADCTDMLLEEDNPSTETIKMQVAFDSSHVAQEEALDTQRRQRDRLLADLQKSIIDVKPRSSSDFEVLTALYRQIFAYLLKHADVPNGNRLAEREIAAALESVFPRIGLKSFITLSAEDKRHQLKELANIVLGIRLFNREIGKGGEGLDDSANMVQVELNALAMKLRVEVDQYSEVCQQYTDVLVYTHHRHPQDVTPDMQRRWQDELANRRQYLSYLESLQEDVLMSARRVETARDAFRSEMEDLKNLVGSRTSVPKEQVYPKFDSLAVLWTQLGAEREVVDARDATWETLQRFADTFGATLSASSPILQEARKHGAATDEEEAEAAAKAAEQAAQAASSDNEDGKASETKLSESKISEGKMSEGKDGEAGDDDLFGGAGSDDVPVRLSIDSTPEFMQLPLEYQGYCPWTIVTRDGLLLQGNPSLGVVRYRNTFTVFVHEVALQAFLDDPDTYTRGVLDAARRAPELIHLLRLQEHFPQASLARLLRVPPVDGQHPLLAAAPAEKVDAGTSTPTHFVERNIDPSYDWNEWSLRRKALQLANLRKAATLSTQTDMSQFRSEKETQVYLPRQKGTQTTVSRGTNPKRVTTYLAGVRGLPRGVTGPSRFARKSTSSTSSGAGPSGASDEESAESPEVEPRPAVVNLTFEL